MTDEVHVLGILAGIGLFLMFQSAVIYFNFAPWLKNPNLLPGPEPERFLRAAIHSLVAMIATGAFLTHFFSSVDLSDTPLIKWFGYNSICIVFDTQPSTYVMPVFWFFVAYLIVRFAVEDGRRFVQLTNIGATAKKISYGVNVLLVIVAAFFSLCLAIGPGVNMFAHLLPYMALMLTLPLVFLMHCWQSENPTRYQIGAVALFIVVGIVDFAFAAYGLAHTTTHAYVSPHIARPIGLLWIIMALSAPFVMPSPSVRNTTSRAAYA
jgi:hypothetical protein